MESKPIVQLESPQEQERRARRHFHARAAFRVGLIVGGWLFMFPSGGPWGSTGIFTEVMGRALGLAVWVTAILHFTLAIGYASVIGAIIYRSRLLMASIIGIGTGLALYGANFALFSLLNQPAYVREGQALLTHLLFGLAAAIFYKAVSVPPPREYVRDA